MATSVIKYVNLSSSGTSKIKYMVVKFNSRLTRRKKELKFGNDRHAENTGMPYIL